MVKGPIVKESGAPVSRLLIVWLVAASVPIVIALVKELGMHTLSVETGTAPVLQLLAVVH
jgi:hypothetical protein